MYLALNGFLLVAPFIPPPDYSASDWTIHYVFPIVSISVLLFGALYWAIWTKTIPRLRGYRIESRRVFGHNGELVQYHRVSISK